MRKNPSSAGLKRANSSGVFTPSYYGTPVTAKRRSEIDVKMEYLRGNSGGLRNAKAVQQCIQLFNLAYPVTSAGVPSIAQRDLGLLLEAVALTVNPNTQIAIIEKGFLPAAQTCMSRLGRVKRPLTPKANNSKSRLDSTRSTRLFHRSPPMVDRVD